MHGSPLLRALAAFVAILFLGLPLWRLTHPHAVAETVTAPVGTEGAKAIHLQLAFTQVPEKFRILFLGKELWKEPKPSAEMERDFQVPYPKEGIDLVFEIEWPGDTLSAARVQLRTPDGRNLDKTIWGKGKAEETLTFE